MGTANFGQIFKTLLPGNFNGIGPEQVFSQPLVLTGNDGVQYIYIVTTQNNIYKLNAKTGALIYGRNLHVPFLTADLDGCVDINPTVGVTATGVIDPATGIWYFTSKTYSDAYQNGKFSPTNTPGRSNGRYYFHGIDTQSSTLVDVFPPTMIDGTIFRNNPNRMFLGGIQHSRPALVIAGNYVYTGYASHCVKWNFTGAIIGFNKANGQIVEAFATQGGPEPNTVPGGGVWMSGGGISYDGSSLFFATGNGYASQLSGTPVPGRQPPTALEEAAVNAKINSDGTLSIIDFFMPWEKQQLDGADKDLGTTPLEILPTDVFTCPNVRRMGVVTGKSGKTYVLNLDNLGGYQMGPNKLDAAVFVYQNENSVYAGAGVMPLGGGYIYINIIKYQTRVFKFGCDSNGNPTFTVIAYTPEFNAAILGTGHGTTTSLNGQDGTGLLWTSDVEGLNLRIYNAIPQNGLMTLINSFNIPGVTKFTRPVFGDGRVYIGTTTGYFYGFGSPVNLPLNCSSPYIYGQQSLGTTSAPLTITCTALTQTTVLGLSIAGNPNFVLASNASSSVANKTYAAGKTFSFQASFKPATVGPLSSDIIVNTTNAVNGFSTNTPVTLRGTGYSANPLLQIGPNTVSFNAIVNATIGGVNQTSLFNNLGNATLNVANFLFSQKSETGPWVQPTISGTNGSLVYSLGSFTFYNLPASIPPNGVATVTINYQPTALGNEALFLNTTSNGGSALLDIVAVGGAQPKALIQFERWDAPGQWTTLDNSSRFTFGNVTENQSRSLRLMVTNAGGPNAVGLSITVSKPPYGVPGIVGANNNIDLAEGTLLSAGQNATATLFCAVPKSQVNIAGYVGSANWTMNTGDPTLGKQFMEFDCGAVAEQVGPLFNNGSAQYGYIGCFRDNTPSRQLATNIYTDTANNTPDKCIKACAAAGWIYAATQYMQECWCGNAIPLIQDMDRDCNFACTGNGNQICGGQGYAGGRTEMSLYADLTRYVNVTSPALAIPPTVAGYNYVGCFAEKGGRAVSAAGVGYTDTVGMTVEKCQAYCYANGKYPYFSLEYAQECQCGNSINFAIATITSDSSCGMTCKGNNSEYCGAGNFAQVYNLNGTKFNYTQPTSSAAATTVVAGATPTPTVAVKVLNMTGYTNMGCYNETHDRRAILGAGTSSTTNSLESCATFCYGWNYFGVEFGSECYCSNYIYSNSYFQPPPNKCTMPCPGNANETCGGPDALNVWYINATSFNPTTTQAAAANNPAQSTATPTVVPAVGSYSYQGCYSEIGGRTLRASGVSNSSVSVEMCAQFCNQYQYFGVEYSQECYCGTALQQGTTAGQTNCNMPCVAAPGEICGGAGSLSVYMSNGTFNYTNIPTQAVNNPAPVATATSTTVPIAGAFSYIGCYNEIGGRALRASSFDNSSTTVEMCAQYCNQYQYFGVEYSSECYCGNTIYTGSTNGSNACTMSCVGNPNETCGGSGGLSMYMQNGTFVTPSNTQPAVAPAPTSTAITVQSIAAFTYQGCFNEVPGRAMQGISFSNSSASIETCAAFCKNWQYFGVEYASECYCASSIQSGSTNSSTACTMPCAGNSGEICGGSNAINVYAQPASNLTTTTATPTPTSTSTSTSTTSTASATPTVFAPAVIGTYISMGCYSDNNGGRALTQLYANDTMSLDICAQQAAANSAAYFGVEYGRECWYGNALGGSNTALTQSKCSFICAANK